MKPLGVGDSHPLDGSRSRTAVITVDRDARDHDRPRRVRCSTDV